MLINKQVIQSYWEGIESDSVPKMIDNGIMQIDDRYYNAINIDELIIIENQQP